MSHLAMSGDKLSKHIRENPAVAERDELLRRVDARAAAEFDGGAGLALRANGDGAAGSHLSRGQTDDVEAFASGQAERCGALPARELHRQHPHVPDVAAVTPLDALR